MSIKRKSRSLRQYQADAIYSILQQEEKCIVKMFCGSGKSVIMQEVMIRENQDLTVTVFPSLALIRQFIEGYITSNSVLNKKPLINISSENLDGVVSTTDPDMIKRFLGNKGKRLVCVTYQSFDVFIDCLGGVTIGLILYDEAHHCVGTVAQKLIFEKECFDKQIFLTATPKNENGVVMFDRDEPENGMCGELAFEYSYYQGMKEGYLNPFDICVDMYTGDKGNKSVYEAIARTVISTGNGRVLTFHAGVNGDGDTTVRNFLNRAALEDAFNRIYPEFPDKPRFKNITMRGITGEMPASQRTAILEEFDATLDDSVYLIASHKTIGEGVDTKNANMCVFVDPKSSLVDIIQNIGRVVRKQLGDNRRKSTVLIPCWVDRTKYLDAATDDDRDKIIRDDIREGGDFDRIMNVLAALKQEDPDLYEECLNYPNDSKKLSEREVSIDMARQGLRVDYAEEPMEQQEVDELIDSGDRVEIWSNDEQTEVEQFNPEGEETVRLYRTDEGEYFPVVSTGKPVERKKKADTDEGERPRIRLSIHTSSDLKMLWRVVSDIDMNKGFSTAVIDCEVSLGVENWLRRHQELVDYMEREKKAPSRSDKDPGIKRLSVWVGNQKKNYKNNASLMKDPKIRKQWEDTVETYKEYLIIDNVELWNKYINDVVEYIEREKKAPSSIDKDKDIKYIGLWVCRQKSNYAKTGCIMKDHTIRNKWERTVEKYREYLGSPEEIWIITLKELVDYIEDNRKAPSAYDKDKDIKYLGLWVYRQKRNYEEKTQIMEDPTIRKQWEETVEKYKDYLVVIDNVDLWKATLEKLIDYMVKNKTRPSTRDKDPAIKRLGSWVSNQKKNYANNAYIMKDPNIRKQWEDTVERYKEYLVVDNLELWNDTLKNVVEYMDNNNKRPNSKDKDPDIKRLGIWICTQNKNYEKNIDIMKDPNIRKKWEDTVERYKEYLVVDNLELWNDTLKNVVEYMDNNKKRPSTIDKDPDIKRLGSWVSNQKKNYANNAYIMKDPNIRKQWEDTVERYKEYLIVDNLEIWNDTLKNVVEYMDKNKKAPSTIHKDHDIKRLGSWVSNQKNNYNNKIGIMKDPKIRKEWKKTLRGYKEYLSPNESLEDLSADEEEEEEVEEEEEKQPIPKRKIVKKTVQKEEPVVETVKKKVLTRKKPAEVETPKLTYPQMTEEQRQSIIERYLKSRETDNTLGYRSTNPDDKDTINSAIAGAVGKVPSGKLVFLDHTEFKTANAMLAAGCSPDDMIIPQRDVETYEQMKTHEIFGHRVILMDFDQAIEELVKSQELVAMIYADFTQCLPVAQRFIHQVKLLNLVQRAIIGVTITLRNPEGSNYTNSDVVKLTCLMKDELPKWQFLHEHNDAYVYGAGAPMATLLVKFN